MRNKLDNSSFFLLILTLYCSKITIKTSKEIQQGVCYENSIIKK